jgi:hypothetical protein
MMEAHEAFNDELEAFAAEVLGARRNRRAGKGRR